MHEDFSGYPRPDLIRYVMSQCVIVPPRDDPGDLFRMTQWCEKHVGECRPGNIIQEAQEGWLDYFDGDWCDLRYDGKLVFWFAREQDRMEFLLSWC